LITSSASAGLREPLSLTSFGILGAARGVMDGENLEISGMLVRGNYDGGDHGRSARIAADESYVERLT
jgi:hypothetical protein